MARGTGVCLDCGASYALTSPNKQRCDPCRTERRRRMLRERDRERAAERAEIRGKRPKVAKMWTCQGRCHERKPISAYPPTGARICLECRARPPRTRLGIPADWKVPFQWAKTVVGVEIQNCAPSECYTCLWLNVCSENVQDGMFSLPCWEVVNAN